MKREEKKQTRCRSIGSALAGFFKQGYGASAINTICAAHSFAC